MFSRSWFYIYFLGSICAAISPITSFCLSVLVSLCLSEVSVHVSLCLSVCLCDSLSVCRSVYLSVWFFFFQSVWFSVCLCLLKLSFSTGAWFSPSTFGFAVGDTFPEKWMLNCSVIQLFDSLRWEKTEAWLTQQIGRLTW